MITYNFKFFHIITSLSVLYHKSGEKSIRSIVYHQAAGKYTLARDEIQPRGADDIHRTLCGDDMPSLRLG
jgi:hypothetical protein